MAADEQAFGVFHEGNLQRALVPVADFFSLYYMFGFGPLIATVLAWLLLCHRGLYRELRTLLFVSLGIALVFYVTYPTAPPRLVSGLGIADTVGLSWRGDGGGALEAGTATGSFAGIAYNPYAAMPSMHVGWALLVGWFAYRAARWLPLRLLFGLHPLLMAITVTATGNHYFVDSLVGVIVVFIAAPVVAAVRRLAHALPSRPSAESAPAPAAAVQALPSYRPGGYRRTRSDDLAPKADTTVAATDGDGEAETGLRAA